MTFTSADIRTLMEQQWFTRCKRSHRAGVEQRLPELADLAALQKAFQDWADRVVFQLPHQTQATPNAAACRSICK